MTYLPKVHSDLDMDLVSKHLHCWEKGDDKYGFISNGIEGNARALNRVVKLLKRRKTYQMKFLDVGCGTGNIMVQAATIARLAGVHLRVDGIEFREDLACLAQQATRYEGDVSVGDAREFENYGDYDIIYWYHPLYDPRKMYELEEKIMREAKKGAIFIVNYAAWKRLNRDLPWPKCRHINMVGPRGSRYSQPTIIKKL